MTPQHKQIFELHRDGFFHCSTEIEYIRDARKRISELNRMGYKFQALPCDGRCGKHHNSRLFMRRLVEIPESSPNPKPVQQPLLAPNQFHYQH